MDECGGPNQILIISKFIAQRIFVMFLNCWVFGFLFSFVYFSWEAHAPFVFLQIKPEVNYILYNFLHLGRLKSTALLYSIFVYISAWIVTYLARSVSVCLWSGGRQIIVMLMYAKQLPLYSSLNNSTHAHILSSQLLLDVMRHGKYLRAFAQLPKLLYLIKSS